MALVTTALVALFAMAATAHAGSVTVSPKPVNGTVIDDRQPPTINCGVGGDDCNQTYPGTIDAPNDVVLTAVPAAGYSFTGWTGCTGGVEEGDTCSFTFVSGVSRTVSAGFADLTDPSVTLTAPVSGSLYGAGSIVSAAANASDSTGVMNRVDFKFTHTGSGQVLTLSDNVGPTWAVSNGVGAFQEGTWSVWAVAVDGSGRTATSLTRSFTVDKTPPTVSVQGPPAFTNSSSPVTSFSATDGATEFRCTVDGGAEAACTGAGSHSVALADGAHTVGVRARDAAGNWSGLTTVNFTVDTAPPSASFSAPAAGTLTNAAEVVAEFTSDGTGSGIAERQCRLDDGPFGDCSSATTHSVSPSGDGPHTVTVRVVDHAGNAVTASRSFTVDRTGPAITITGPPAGGSVASDPVAATYTISDASAITARECRFGDGAFIPCSESKYEQAGLPAGAVTFTIRATDAAGNTSEAARSFTVARTSGGGGSGGDNSGGGGPGSAAPPVAALVEGGWRFTRRYTVFNKLRVIDVPGGASIQVRCKGRGCPFKKRAVRVTGARVNLLKLVRKRKLRVGTVLEVRITKPGAIGKVVRIKIRRSKSPSLTRLCLPPGATSPGAC